MQVKYLSSNIIYFRFHNQRDLCRTMIRFQEHYESPKFRNKIFTLGQFRKWYTKENDDEFTYYEDWNGFNLPHTAFKKFLAGDFDPLNDGEKLLLDTVRLRTPPFYVVATSRDDEEEKLTLRHELAHALFGISDAYQNKVCDVVCELGRSIEILEEHLLDIGYGSTVLFDECHAYLMYELKYLQGEGIDITPYKECSRKLKRIFRKYLKKEGVWDNL